MSGAARRFDGPDRTVPHDLHAERAVLGGILLENQALGVVLRVPLAPDDFYTDAHAQIFSAMLELRRTSAAIDTVTLRECLQRNGKLPGVGGDECLFGLTNTIPNTANIKAHAEIVRDRSLVRSLLHACQQTLARGYGDYGSAAELFESVERAIAAIATRQWRSPYEHVQPVLARTFETIIHAAELRVVGLPTGFKRLDRMTAGMQPGDFIVVAGRSGVGKTAFALNIALHACAVRQTAVAMFTLEMSKEKLAARLLCSEARVDAERLGTGFLSREDWAKLTAAADRLSALPFYVDDAPALSLHELRSKARQLKTEHNVGLVVVDYLQLMRSGTMADGSGQELGEISRSLKALAKELGMPIVALSQLDPGAESRCDKEKRPQLSELRESGGIEQDADTVLFVHQSAVSDVAEIIVSKQRSGPTGTVKCMFRRECSRFEDLHEQQGDRHGFEGAA